MSDKKDQYNLILERIEKANKYFQTAFQNDTEDAKVWAVQTFTELLREAENLYYKLRPVSLTSELQYGFENKKLTLKINVTDEFESILQNLDIIRAEGWAVEQLEYLKQSQVLLVGLKKSELVEIKVNVNEKLCGGCRFFNYLDVKGLGECVRSNQNFTALNTGCLKWEKGK